jgi:hypothetical protein
MKYLKDKDKNYVINGETFQKLTGSRAEVFHGTAYKTSGKLTKKDLIKNKNNRIVSVKKQKQAVKDNRLINLGFGFKKGEFGVVHLNPVKEQPSVFQSKSQKNPSLKSIKSRSSKNPSLKSKSSQFKSVAIPSLKSKSSQFKSRSSKNPSLKSIKSRSSKNPSYKSISSRFKSVAIPSLKSKSSRIRLKSRSSQFKSVAIPSLKSLSSKNPSLKSIKSKSKSLSKNKKPKKTRKARAKKIKGGSSLNPSSYPFGDFDDLKGLGSFTQQEMLAAPNNTPNDLALLK